jgi:hypothetical protein
MIHQRRKDALFWCIRNATIPNYLLRRYVSPQKTRNGSPIHLNLGCGDKYVEGFVNIDANPRRKLNLWVDVRNGLAFRGGTVDSVYSS